MPSTQLQWTSISDFTPGIRERVMRAGMPLVSAPIGSAVAASTYRCIALPSGGLAPLPRMSRTLTLTPAHAFANIVDGGAYVSGLHLAGPVLANPAPGMTSAELFVALDYIENSTAAEKRRWYLYRFRLWEEPPAVQTIDHVDSAVVSPTHVHRGTFFADYRANPSSPDSPGFPCVSYAWYEEGGEASYANRWAVYPDPTAPTTNNLGGIRTDLSLDGLIGHQGRLVGFEQRQFSHGNPGTWSSNEQLWWTKPNLVTLSQSIDASTLGYEEMVGYGAMGRVSTEELFLVKNRGGALTVNGDLDNPTVIWLPGVQSTHGFLTVGTYSRAGFIYAVAADGVYAWAGQDTAKDISNQLEDEFWRCPLDSHFITFKGKFATVNEWVLAPNNWLYDTELNSWWRIDDPASYSIFQWQYDVINSGLFFGSPVRITSTSDPVVYIFDRSKPASSFRYKSQPIPQSMFRYWHVRELILVATGVGTVTVTLTSYDGSTITRTFTYDSATTPHAIRHPVDIVATHVQVQLDSAATDSANPAPIVWEVRMGYTEREHIGPGVG